MTNEQAIEVLKYDRKAYQEMIDANVNEGTISGDGGKIKGTWKGDALEMYRRQVEVMDMAIKALQEQADGDLISRQAVIDAFHHRFLQKGFEKDRWWNSTHVLAAIEGLPSVAIPNKTGKWLGINKNTWCSNCAIGLSEYIKGEFTVDVEDLPPYCPNCGAKMGGEQDG